MGVSARDAAGHLRLTLGHSNTDEDIEVVAETLVPLVARLRKMSAVYA
jgi:cysteine sulfinate desulfinase/cysteine desulfurase-like protein